MNINDDPSGFEAMAGPPASLSQCESESPERRDVTNMRPRPPSSGLQVVPPRTARDEDTPVYWQTVQAMASGTWRRDG
jgi:hypothetical protein